MIKTQFLNELKEIIDLVFEISDKTDENVFCDYDTNSKLLGVTAKGEIWIIGDDEYMEGAAQRCKLALKKILERSTAGGRC